MLIDKRPKYEILQRKDDQKKDESIKLTFDDCINKTGEVRGLVWCRGEDLSFRLLRSEWG